MRYDPAHRDLGWYGYSPWTLLPLALPLIVVSAVVWLGRWYFEDLSELADRIGTWTLFVLAWGAWPLFLLVWAYRTITYTYRLTDRALLVDFGFRHPYQPPVPLEQIIEITVHQGVIGRYLNVGQVHIRTPERSVLLPGVHAPQGLVNALRQAQHQRLNSHDTPRSTPSGGGCS
jgi:membrane protein YdbS with pleckstrin-like domain